MRQVTIDFNYLKAPLGRLTVPRTAFKICSTFQKRMSCCMERSPRSSTNNCVMVSLPSRILASWGQISWLSL
ncbi:hypothetical protein WJX73_010886 [Symbiochloris irregularis]|uniref:Uncharacterized protein n=1 Tax=Symbiochloris irregularis TaxID=706552 RepID=A0AAW1PFE9_9CHLO